MGNRNKKNSLVLLLLVIGILIFLPKMVIRGTKAYAIYLDDNVIVTTETEDDIRNSIKELEKELSDRKGSLVKIEESIEVKPIKVKEDEIQTNIDIKEEIKETVKDLIKGYELFIEDESIGILESSVELEEIIESFKISQTVEDREDLQLLDVSIVENLDIIKKDVYKNELSDKEEIINKIKTGGVEVQTHIVEEGENFWTISKDYGISYDDIVEANKEVESTKLQIGQEVKLVKEVPLLTVETLERVKRKEDIEYETEEIEDETMYEGDEEIITEGKNGEKVKVVDEIRHNRKWKYEEIIEEEIIKEPIKEIKKIGTKERPKTVATGSFITPVNGRFTSGFGRRWGRLHRGIDLAASTGTKIYASDGGRVVKARYEGSYGYLVEIDHENGYRTKYAHCSEMLVSPGERVSQGQIIAKVGNTGRSTGPHLHFEVVENGNFKNPLNYIKK